MYAPLLKLREKSASPRKISLKSGNRLLNYRRKRFLKWLPFATLNFIFFLNIWLRDCHRVRLFVYKVCLRSSVPNFIKIG